MDVIRNVGIVGAGIVGLAIGREIARRRPGTRIVVFEKEDRVGAHQTGHNSGVVHAGIYYKPGSLKARLCVEGGAMLREYCAERGIPLIPVGKLVVAVSAEDEARLDALASRAAAVPGLRRIGPAEIRDIEPHAAGRAALHSPHTAITDFPAIARAFAEDIVAAGGEIRLGYEVRRLDELRFDRLILCAGLHSDRVAALAGDDPSPRIIPFRGEYLRVLPAKAGLVRGLIYPVPDPRYPFLGVHYTRRVDDTLEVGPNAVLAGALEGYRWRDVSLTDLAGVAGWPGSWRMAARHWRTGVREVRGSLSKRAYMAAARRYVPSIGASDVVRAGSGVRAQALDRDGGLVDDFRIHRLGPVTAVRNAPSPAATSCMAIAAHVADVILS